MGKLYDKTFGVISLGCDKNRVDTEKLLGLLLGAIGLTNVVFDFSVAAVIVPVAAITISFFVFAYLAAKKVKRVEVRELVTE